jgi:hypothetical protein
MALFPFYHHHFFDDPFFFHELDFFDPWFDFNLFPPFVRPTSQFQSYQRQDQLTYSSTKMTNSDNKSLEQTPQIYHQKNFVFNWILMDSIQMQSRKELKVGK